MLRDHGQELTSEREQSTSVKAGVPPFVAFLNSENMTRAPTVLDSADPAGFIWGSAPPAALVAPTSSKLWPVSRVVIIRPRKKWKHSIGFY